VRTASLVSGITNIFDPSQFLTSVGPFALLAVVAIVFIETGLLFPFLPGDSLVFAAAIVIGSIGVSLPVLIFLVAVTAFAGSGLGFAIGRRWGPRLFRTNARVFKTKYRERSDVFFSKYGSGSLVIARFVPVIRTFISPIVGASSMPVRRFLLWNAVGAVSWSVSLVLAGYFLGKIPAVANNIELIAVAIALVSILPILIGYVRSRAQNHRRRRG
jgi:membrane-associated protein